MLEKKSGYKFLISFLNTNKLLKVNENIDDENGVYEIDIINKKTWDILFNENSKKYLFNDSENIAVKINHIRSMLLKELLNNDYELIEWTIRKDLLKIKDRSI